MEAPSNRLLRRVRTNLKSVREITGAVSSLGELGCEVDGRALVEVLPVDLRPQTSDLAQLQPPRKRKMQSVFDL